MYTYQKKKNIMYTPRGSTISLGPYLMNQRSLVQTPLPPPLGEIDLLDVLYVGFVLL